MFDGCSFYLAGEFLPPNPSKEDVNVLLKLSGGKILSREPFVNGGKSQVVYCPYHADRQFTYNQFIVFDPNADNTIIMKKWTSACIDNMTLVPVTWILDCLSHFSLLNISNST